MKTSETRTVLRRAFMLAYTNKTLPPTLAGLRSVAASTGNAAVQELLEMLLAAGDLVRRICGRLASSSHASFLQPRETSRKRKAREYEHCFRALALVEGERGPIKTAMSIMELGKPNRALLGSTRHKRRTVRPPGKRLDRYVSHALLLHPFRRQVEYLRRRLVLVYTITRRKNYKLSTLAKLSRWFRCVCFILSWHLAYFLTYVLCSS